jgi:tripartite-type tricarboxylate transporter receptor subunit TctC
VPTVAEQGFPGFEMTQWYGMLAPASLQAAHVDKLAAECAKAVKAPDALKRLQGDAADPIGSTPAEFARSSPPSRPAGKGAAARPGQAGLR